MISWWRNLQVREQILLILIGVIILSIILYRECWLPYRQARQIVDKQIYQTETQLRWMQQKAAERNQEKMQLMQSAINLNISAEEAVSQTGKTNQLKIQRIEFVGGKVQIYFDEELRFDRFVVWLEQLKQNFGIDVFVIDIESKKPGYVKVIQLSVGRETGQ